MLRKAYLAYAIRELTTRKGRSCAVIAGMSAGIALFVAFATLSEGYRSLIRLPFSRLSVDVTIQQPSASQEGTAPNGIRVPFSNQPITAGNVERVAAVPGIKALSASLLLWSQSHKGFVVIQGMDLAGPSIGPAMAQEWVIKGRSLNGEGREVLLEEHFARFNRKRIGDSVPLGSREFEIVGIVQLKKGTTISAANAYITIKQARALVNVQGRAANMLFARLKRGTDPEAVRRQVTKVLPGAIVSSADNIGDMMKGFNAISGRFSTTMGLLALLFAAIVTYRILAGSVSERAAEIGIMKTVGWKKSDITWTLLAETVMVGVAGGLVGIALGYLGAWVMGSMKISLAMPWNLSPMPAGTGHAGAVNVHAEALPIAFSFDTIGVALAVAAATSGLTGATIARKLARVKVMEALRRL